MIVLDTVCAGELAVEVSTGDAGLVDVRCQDLKSSGGTGDISLENVLVTDEIFIERSTGDVSFDGCDAAAIRVKTSTGDVTGTLLTDKVFWPKSSSGDVEVPDTKSGGDCEITTSTGDIRIHIGA